jgi:hypothetical protein
MNAEHYVIPDSIEQLSGLANISVLVWKVISIACCSSGGVAHWLLGMYCLPCG